VRDIPRLKAEFFKALGHPVRIRVLELLAEHDRTVSELLDQIPVEQPYLSQQLGILRRAGLVAGRRQKGATTYALADERVSDLLALSRQMLLDMLTETRDELRAS
jgi:DNA-binding transcriptional ArsR family regulator